MLPLFFSHPFIFYSFTPFKEQNNSITGIRPPRKGNLLFQTLSSVASPSIFEHRKKFRELYSSLLGIYSVKFKRARQSLYFNLCRGQAFSQWIEEHQLYFDILGAYINIRKGVGKLFDDALKNNHLDLRYSTDLEEYFSLTDLFININWDKLIWENPKIPNKIQLHGVSHIPNSIILPTEFNSDEHPFDLERINQSVADNELEMVGDIFRLGSVLNDDETVFFKHMALSHDLSETAIGSAKQIVMWGVSGSLYDAEFLSILTQLPSCPNLEKIVVINPNKDDALHLYGIIGISLEKFVFYDPIKLEEYSLPLD